MCNFLECIDWNHNENLPTHPSTLNEDPFFFSVAKFGKGDSNTDSFFLPSFSLFGLFASEVVIDDESVSFGVSSIIVCGSDVEVPAFRVCSSAFGAGSFRFFFRSGCLRFGC